MHRFIAIIGAYWALAFLVGCTTSGYMKTVAAVDLDRFMGAWYVIGGRLTSFEDGAHNAVETYSYNAAEKEIDVGFTFNFESFDGELKEINQTAWIKNTKTNAHWLISPFWPLKFDYLIIALDPGYEWTAVGVPSQDYLWILARQSQLSKPVFDKILKTIADTGYRIDDVIMVPHQKKPQ